MALATETSALATGLSASSTTTPASVPGGVSTNWISVSPAELTVRPNCLHAEARPGFRASRNPAPREHFEFERRRWFPW